MKILITGAKGQLGYKLKQILSENHQLILTDSHDMDITDKKVVSDVIAKNKPDIVIHAAAYTKVDDAESEQELCKKINVLGTENVAQACADNNILIFFLSTDYVLAGKKKSPYTEKDNPGKPLNYYGQTKLEAENLVKDICKKHYIIRTSWLYGELPSDHPGSNFVETMLKLAKTKDELNIIDDQIGSPTYTGDLTKAIDDIISKLPTSNPIPFGLYHFSGTGETSWYDFAKEIFKLSNIDIQVNPIPTEDYPLPAKRPKYSYLSKDKIKSLEIDIRKWQDGLKEYLQKRQI